MHQIAMKSNCKDLIRSQINYQLIRRVSIRSPANKVAVCKLNRFTFYITLHKEPSKDFILRTLTSELCMQRKQNILRAFILQAEISERNLALQNES